MLTANEQPIAAIYTGNEQEGHAAGNHRLNRYTDLARIIFKAPITAVTLLAGDNQRVDACHGLDGCDMPRQSSICQFLVDADIGELLVLEDARNDGRTKHLDAVTGDLQIGFYAGALLHDANGERLGSLCVMDHQPRTFDENDRAALMRLRSLLEEDLYAQAELDQASHLAWQSASFDELTGRPMGKSFDNAALAAMETLTDDTRNMGVLVVDPVRLRALNAARGPEAGDRVVQEMAKRLLAEAPTNGVVGRYNNDALLLAVPGAERDEMRLIEHRLSSRMCEPYHVKGDPLVLNVAIGKATASIDHTDVATICEAAKADMRAYTSGVRFANRPAAKFHSDGCDSAADFELEKRLREAIAGENLDLVFQPKVDIVSGRIEGAEALIRWHDEVRGPLSPGVFMPVAERAGLLPMITNLVAHKATETVASWDAAGYPNLKFAMNLAPDDLNVTGLPDHIAKAAYKAGIDPRRITLEITEDAIVQDQETATETMRDLASRGFSFAMDDFGAGYASFGQLRQLPFDEIKIDKSFVQKMTEHENDATMVQTITSMAQNLGLNIVAEGVETEKQLTYLQAYGCNQAQGFYLHKPMSSDGMKTVLAS